MKKEITLVIFLVSIFHFSFSQCDKIKTLIPEPDFCYENSLFKGYCACFKSGMQSFAIYKGKKKPFMVILPKDDSLSTYATWVKNYNKQIAAYDLVFIQMALRAWRVKERYLGFKTLPSGLGYKIKEEGNGKQLEKGMMVEVHYRGYLEDGTVFDDSYRRGKPFRFVLGKGQVIKGWDEGLLYFKEGSKGTLLIPPALGYGERGVPGVIPPNATLFFDIEVLKAYKP